MPHREHHRLIGKAREGRRERWPMALACAIIGPVGTRKLLAGMLLLRRGNRVLVCHRHVRAWNGRGRQFRGRRIGAGANPGCPKRHDDKKQEELACNGMHVARHSVIEWRDKRGIAQSLWGDPSSPSVL